MRHFDEIYDIAAKRKGGAAAIEAQLERPKSTAEICAIPETAWLTTFARGIMAVGLNWKVIETKWPGMLEAFKGFDVDACAMMSEDWFDELISDRRIIRHGAKIQSIRDNAVFLTELRSQGGASQVFATWPREDFAGLLALLKKDGSRLGGNTGAYCLRHMGIDSYILTRDVTGRLIAEGV
ncbi:MAG: DNA-3-methyladenine glycosylase I, partial [Mangrovicoccus sp.]